MRYAIVSDIHSNRPAWQAVLDDIARQGVDAVACLGDVVGYGPRPRAVLESVREHCANIVLGNHDAVIAGRLDPEAFNLAARAAIDWTRERLGAEGREYFASLPLSISGDGIVLVHADAAKPESFRYIIRPEHARSSFRSAGKNDVIFIGHTHQPGVFTAESARKTINKLPPRDMVLTPGKHHLVNPGSVGDPRSPDDLRASYCLFDTKTRRLEFRRVEFDVEAYRQDFEASGLIHKPYFLRVLDAESLSDTGSGALREDHGQNAVFKSEARLAARLNTSPVPRAAPPVRQQMVLRQQMESRRQASRAGVWLCAAAIIAVGIGIGLAIEHFQNPEKQPLTESTPATSAARVTPVTSQPASQKTVIKDDLESILAEDGWEDPGAAPAGKPPRSVPKQKPKGRR